MNYFTFVRNFFLFTIFAASFSADAQVIQPLGFGAYTLGTGTTNSNWYANYVGLQFNVTAPAVIAGPKAYSSAYDPSSTSSWAVPVTTPLYNKPIYMDSTNDSFGGSAFPPGEFAGKIAVIWRGPISAPYYFSCKALNAQNAGALAVIIVNEYPGEGPVGMSADASCPGTSVTIPVFSIGNLDGIAISGQFHSGVPVTMSITNWGFNLRNDIGFVPDGVAGWHSIVVPSNQIPAGQPLPAPYKGVDGAYIANYGTSAGSGVGLATTLRYTPNGGSASVLHTDTVLSEVNFPVSDSIWYLLDSTEYNFAPPSSGPGMYQLTYTIMSDTPNINKTDTSLAYTFYTSDSVYSKGRYDLANAVPIVNDEYGFTTDYTWGNMYYVAHGHDAISSVQFTLFNPTGTFGSISTSIPSVNTYIFKWVDGTGGGQAAPDSIIQNGELDMVAQGVYSFGSADTSGVIFKTFMMDSNGVSGIPIYLDTNAWYYVCVDVEGGNVFLGMDGGLTDELPRVFGRYNATGYLEYMNWFWSGDVGSGLSNPLPASPTANEGVLPYPETAYLNSVDSFNYSAEKGLVPAIAMIITDNPDTSNVHVAVNQVNKSFADINLYPNPATDHINVAVSLSQMAPTVKYTIIDGLAHVVSRQYHYNVTNDNFDISTSDLASGTYFFIMNANGKVLSRKFTVIK